MLKLELFGTGQASYSGQYLTGFPKQQSHLLLCYLLLNPCVHPREKLAAIFWGEYPDQSSRKHLSQALWRLRQTLQSVNAPSDNYLIVHKENVSFNTESSYWLDIDVFETTITHCQNVTGQQLTLQQATELDEATALYTGDLLEGIYDDWCLYDRERLSLLYLDALGKLMIFYEFNEMYEQGLSYGERLLRCDNTREQIHQQMMRLYWLVGNRSAAIGQYKRCCQILRDEFNATPLKETNELYQLILHNRFQPALDPTHRHETALSPLVRSEETLKIFADESLQRIAHLQSMIDEIHEEFSALQHFISTTLIGSRKS